MRVKAVDFVVVVVVVIVFLVVALLVVIGHSINVNLRLLRASVEFV